MREQSLAAQFFLLAHDPFTDGRLALSPELLGCGLVAAELADLVLGGRLRVDDDLLNATSPAPRFTGTDQLGDLDKVDTFVLQTVREQQTSHSVRSWVEPLQDGVYGLVSSQLVESGIVEHHRGGRRIGRARQPDRFPPLNLLAAHQPQQVIQEMLRNPRTLTLRIGTLAAVVHALSAEKILNLDLDRTMARELLAELDGNLPSDLRAICDAIRAATSEISLRSV